MLLCVGGSIAAAAEPPIAVDFQPLAANAARLVEAMEFLGRPLNTPGFPRILPVIKWRDTAALEKELAQYVDLVVSMDAAGKLYVSRPEVLHVQQAGYVPLVVKIINLAGTTAPLTVTSPQAGPVYGGESEGSLTRQGRLDLRSDLKNRAAPERFLNVEWFASQPMTPVPRGIAVEYAILLVYAHAAGKQPGTLRFTLGAGDDKHPAPMAEVKTMFEVRPAVPVRLRVRDVDGSPTVGRFTFRDRLGHVYPPQAKRVAPDFFFQEQVYRRDGDTVLLPPGELTVEFSRGPEYKLLARRVTIPPAAEHEMSFDLQRWIDPMSHGFYCGDHHIHAAGCAHYTLPTEGVHADDMFLQVKGEGLNVGSVLTWGPCYDYQRQFFSAGVDPLSEPLTLLKYDVEVSGFGSAPLGHVCLLNLRDQTYPGSEGTKTKGWPTWTTPVMRWTKAQGGYTGYAHSASGLSIDANAAAGRLLKALDTDGNGQLTAAEAARGLLTEPFAIVDANHDQRLDLAELVASHRRAADQLPNYAIPEMNGSGAMEICVSAAQGVCDFISAMDTERIQEWNTWYHLLNCGLPIKVSGETDFPCMSSTRVGQGRVYVQLGKVERLDYAEWCRGLAEGRSYVSDGYAHAVDFAVAGRHYGEQVRLAEPGEVEVTTKVAFGSQTPPGVPYGSVPTNGRRSVGDTRTLYPDAVRPQSNERRVEVIYNGQVAAEQIVPADDAVHELKFRVPVTASGWIAVRQFPQLHTNPIDVIVADRPIRASRKSAEWCIGVIEQLWRTRARAIKDTERGEAERAFEDAKSFYRNRAAESPVGS